jgi:fucose permease
MFAVLHPAFALTGVVHAIGGALLPSIASTFQLTDAQSGSLFFWYFLGTSLGALFCVRHYARLMYVGFAVAAVTCAGIANAPISWFGPLFLLLGIGVGVPMTAVSMYAGMRFADRSAAPLTLLNFSWSIGAFLAPLLASRILLHHNYRTAYVTLGMAAALAAAACWFGLEDDPASPNRAMSGTRSSQLRWVVLFALLTFLEVGIENTTATWLATYALRVPGTGTASAVASSSLYWCGFLASRGFFSLVLLRANPVKVLRGAVMVALGAASLLVGASAAPARDAAMMVLGAALAPIFPLLLARFFAGADNSSDSRWILATCGFGGSVLPWLTGWISATSHSLHVGLATVPGALLVMLCILPALARAPQLAAGKPIQQH